MSLFIRLAKWLLVVWLVLVVVGFFSAAFAQALPVGVSPVFAPTYAGNGVSFAGGTATAANAASLTFGNAANGAVYAEQQAALALSGGRTATVAIRSAPSALAVAGAIGRFASKVATPLVVGVALYDLAKELGFDLSNSSGTLVVRKSDSTVCTVGPCYSYISVLGGVTSPAFPTAAQSQQWSRDHFNATHSPSNFYIDSQGASSFTIFSPTAYATIYGTTSGGVVAPSDPVYEPSTVAALQSAVQSVTTWPEGSSIGRAVTDAVKSGEPLPLPAPNQITGPASVPGSPTVVTNPDGSKVTTTPVTNITYGPSSVTFNDTTQITNTSTGGVDSPGPTTAAPTELPKTCGYPGGPACKIDETGTPSDSPVTEAATQSGMDALKNANDSLVGKALGDADKQWSWTLLGAPPVAQCEVLPLPTTMGISVPSVDPCGTVDGIRSVMAWIWAFVGFYSCIGLVREVL